LLDAFTQTLSVHKGCVDKYNENVKFIDGAMDLSFLVENKQMYSETVLYQSGIDDLSNYSPTEYVKENIPVILNWVKAPTGTGKTEGINQFRKRKGKAVIISPTLALVSSNAKDFNAIAVNGDTSSIEDLPSASNISTTIHSLQKLSYVASLFPSFEIVIVDEASQCLSALLNMTDIERKESIIKVLRVLFQSAKHIVLCDADLTESVIADFERVLQLNVDNRRHHIARKNDLKGRDVFMYGSTGDLILELSVALNQGKRCLVIVNSKLQLKRLKRAFSCTKGSYFFSSDAYGETTIDDFRNDPATFVKRNKPNLLACTQLLKSGVSFVESFDEVFVIDYGSHSTDRAIVQMISRERAWKRAHIYTNSITTSLPQAVANASSLDMALVSSQKDLRDQLIIRPIGTAIRLNSRGANVKFLPSKHTRINLDEMGRINYCKVGADGRREYEEYIYKLFNTQNLSTVESIKGKYSELSSVDGFIDTLSEWKKGNPLDLYNWVQSKQVLKKALGTHFKTFGTKLKSYGFDDDGFFLELAAEGIRNSELKRDNKLLPRVLEGFEFTTLTLDKATENLTIHKTLMSEIDKLDNEKSSLTIQESINEAELTEEDIETIYGEICRDRGATS